MLDLKAKNGGIIFELFNFAMDIVHITRKSFAKFHHQFVRPIIQNANAPEYDYASDIERPMTILVIAIVVNTERDLITFCNCIELVSDLSAVEKDLIAFFIKVIIDRQSVWIRIIAIDSEYATYLLF